MNNQPCPVCKGMTVPFFVGKGDLLECIHCHIVFDTRVSYDRNFYEHRRAASVDTAKIEARRRNVRQRINLIKALFHKDISLLDIGCGEGVFLREVLAYVREAKGLEPTLFYVDYARKNFGLDVQEGLIEDVDFPNDVFSVITMFHVIEHVDDPVASLEKIGRWLKTGGHLVVEVPNIKSPTARYKGLNWEMIIPEHRFQFCEESLRYVLDRAGFRLISVRTRDFDQYRTSIGKNLRKLGVGKQKYEPKALPVGHAVSVPGIPDGPTSAAKKIRRFIQLPLKALLGWLVMKRNRSDYLFAIARKSEPKTDYGTP